MAKSLVLHNMSGDVVRVFPWTRPERIWAIFRKDTKRVEILSSLKAIDSKKIPYKVLTEATGSQLENKLDIGSFGYLELADHREITPILEEVPKSNFAKVRKAALFTVFAYLLTGFLITDVFAPVQEIVEEVVEEKKREIVKVVRKKLVIPKTSSRRTVSLNTVRPTKVNPTAKRKGWKRRGALAALGALNKSKQKGGLDLGAVKATAGPGLGGSQGSGGVQTSIYAKGMVAAPLGAGHNIKGGGGYGTKGKGGGKAGYGTMSLIGSTGASLIPIPEEATVSGGLDGSLIADVVRRNLGQIRFCYEQGLQMDSSLAGRVAVNWVIDANGGVKVARVKNTSLKNKTVEDCILRRLRTWKFPMPEGSQEVPVSYPFLLKRQG
ncbi:MAG: AgmX/PglI C-terminal domain-containing protein [Bdellovibrionales bacterium]|nr:AgmX/PglI C-terminal domain-containing protein [Bdellovibrionales bacterium]NQZ18094.1 AgmX/PglI C-terminal domain-containing protein [Bdellovibrionales bacterium]